MFTALSARTAPQEKGRSEIEKGKGYQFDKAFADIMLETIDEDKDYTMREGTESEASLREKSSEDALSHMDKATTIPDKLLNLNRLDCELGVYLCGDVEDYLSALSVFADSISSKSKKIESALMSEDIEIYTTLVHSLKSSARTIGATDISDLAKKLEAAGKDKNLDFIKENTKDLISLYRSLEEPLRSILSPQ